MQSYVGVFMGLLKFTHELFWNQPNYQFQAFEIIMSTVLNHQKLQAQKDLTNPVPPQNRLLLLQLQALKNKYFHMQKN